MLKQLIFVFIGGGLGSVFRYAIGKYLNPTYGFPLGTFAVNVIGSLLLGILLGYATRTNQLSTGLSLLLATGFCGGFTTFSTFVYESQTFLKEGNLLHFGLYTLGSFAVALAAVLLGIWISKQL